jgi:pesticin/yersiniabactin receptor
MIIIVNKVLIALVCALIALARPRHCFQAARTINASSRMPRRRADASPVIGSASLPSIRAFSLLGLLPATLLTTAVAALAEETPGDVIIVTASKRPQPIGSIDGLVAVAMSDNLDLRGFQGVEQLDRLFADLSLRARSSRAYANVTIRGQSSADFYNPSAQLFVDGLPQDQALFFQLLPVGLDRVETLYGPQGTLYGRGAVGGVINVVTRKPGDGPMIQGTGAVTELGETGQVLATLSLVPDTLQGDALVAMRREQGALSGLSTGRTLGGSSGETARLRLHYAPAGGGIDLMASVQRGVLRSDEEYFVPAPYLDQRRALEVPSHYRLRTDSYGFTASFDLGFATLTALTGYQDRDLDRTIFGSHTPETQRTFNQELRLASVGGGAVDYVAGLYYEDLRFTRIVPAYTLGSRQVIRTMAAFGELSWHATDKLDITPGLRVSRELTHADTSYGPLSLANRDEATSLLPKLALGYQANKALRLHAIFSTGFKAGGFTRAVTPATIAFSYDPQHSYNFELGAALRSADGRTEASLSAYYVVNTGFQLSVGPVSGMYLQNVGTTRAKGLNLNGRLEPVDDLTLTLSGSLNKSWFSRYDNPANPGIDLAGNRMPYAPEAMLNASLRYDITLPGFGRLSPHGGISLIGRSWFDEANSLGQTGYALLDAGLSWQAKTGLALDLYGDNLTDRHYTTYGFDAGPGIGPVYQLGKGRELGVRARAAF